MIWFEANGTVWKVEDKGNYARINFSTSRKDKETGEYHNSSWFANVVGKAYDFVKNSVERGDFVHIKGRLSNERYQDDYGNWQNRKTPDIMIYDMDYYENSGVDMDKPPRIVAETESQSEKPVKLTERKSIKAQPPDDEELPF